jgi:hypothetical protein
MFTSTLRSSLQMESLTRCANCTNKTEYNVANVPATGHSYCYYYEAICIFLSVIISGIATDSHTRSSSYIFM